MKAAGTVLVTRGAQAGTAAAVDGPIPVGDLIGAAVLIVGLGEAAHEAIKAYQGSGEPQVYHRRAGTAETQLVQQSGELQGKGPRNLGDGTGIPAAKAYSGPLPANVPGYEFTTPAVPSSGSPGVMRPGGQVNWREGDPGVRKVDDETVAIPVTVTKVQQ